MKKPDAIYNPSTRSTPSPMPDQIPDPSIRGEAWDQLLQNRGIRFIHRVAIPCPNMKGLNENNHSPNCSYCDNSQMIYKEFFPGTTNPREIWGVFTSNTLEKMFEVQGVWDIGTAVVTLPAEYPGGQQAEFSTFDQLYCPDFEVRLNDLIEYKSATNKITRLRYPVVSIEYMSAVVNGSLYDYVEGTDFDITADGDIQWLIEPSYDAVNDIGQVISIVYNANPVYTVQNVLHEMRVSQQYDFATGQKIAKRLPQQVLVKRDFLFQQEDQN